MDQYILTCLLVYKDEGSQPWTSLVVRQAIKGKRPLQ
jgi:hypothetical protein